ncbi:transposase [Aceticella autotrophica]|uniref:Transposase n=1 Tax=Aceticella autotrophica TaxID=2755338 RepID=A0A975AX71_9THEO|nr:transposase [Aceticella autotrophica]QSZ28127.1 transposase [Aceticella autotrophica]
MARNKTPSFVLTLKLDTQKYQEDILDKRFNIGRMIYNACLSRLYKNYILMKESKEYRKTCKMPKGKERNEKFNALRIKYNLTISYIDNYAAPMQHKFKKNIDSSTAQKLAERALDAVNKLIYGKARKVHFKKYSEEISLEGKTNSSGIKYRDGYIVWNDLKIPVIIKPNDKYAQSAIQSRVKYCRIFRQYIGNRYKYYVQLILEGIPPMKKRTIGKGDVGLDAGTQTESIVSDKEVKLVELAPEINTVDREIIRLQRKLDRSRRAANPENYNFDGTVKKGTKGKWKKSKNHIKTQIQLKDRYRKRAEIRKQSLERLANYIISLGNKIKVENMNYTSLSKRTKETTKNRTTKRFNRKKRFGKSIGTKSPGLHLNIIDRKLHYFGEKLIKVDKTKVKASQYNHIDNIFDKKDLSERWNTFIYKGNEIKVQRDLYSAFLLQNTENDELNRDKCIAKFDNFLKLHDKELKRLKELKETKPLISSMGI